jgi:hypothetical protein
MTNSKNPVETEPVLMQEAQLRVFIATGTVLCLSAIFRGNHFELMIAIGEANFVLGSVRGEIRRFVTLDTLAGTIARLGGKKFTVNVIDFVAKKQEMESTQKTTNSVLSKLDKTNTETENKQKQSRG